MAAVKINKGKTTIYEYYGWSKNVYAYSWIMHNMVVCKITCTYLLFSTFKI